MNFHQNDERWTSEISQIISQVVWVLASPASPCTCVRDNQQGRKVDDLTLEKRKGLRVHPFFPKRGESSGPADTTWLKKKHFDHWRRNFLPGSKLTSSPLLPESGRKPSRAPCNIIERLSVCLFAPKMHEVQTAAWINSPRDVGRLYFSSGTVQSVVVHSLPARLVLKFWLFVHEFAKLWLCRLFHLHCTKSGPPPSLSRCSITAVIANAGSASHECVDACMYMLAVHVSFAIRSDPIGSFSDCGSATAQRGPTAERPCRRVWHAWAFAPPLESRLRTAGSHSELLPWRQMKELGGNLEQKAFRNTMPS